jgi:hypothetical protein
LAFAGQQFLAFLGDFTLHLELNLAKLLFLATELLLLEAD